MEIEMDGVRPPEKKQSWLSRRKEEWEFHRTKTHLHNLAARQGVPEVVFERFEGVHKTVYNRDTNSIATIRENGQVLFVYEEPAHWKYFKDKIEEAIVEEGQRWGKSISRPSR